MDSIITLKKKLSSFVSDKGYLINVSDEVYFELLKTWEGWTGPSKEFYSSLGFSYYKIAGLLGKAKKMQREGHFGTSDFKEVQMESSSGQTPELSPCGCAEVILKNGQVVRFSQVDLLVEFLKKAA